MCTALYRNMGGHYFGRNLDIEKSYNERITLTPRRFSIALRHLPCLTEHHAMIGMASAYSPFPLYYEAMNECGLAAAALSFPGNAHYEKKHQNGKKSLCPFELIPYLLSTCDSVEKIEEMLRNISIIDENLSNELPNTPLHFLFADQSRCITVEPMREGMRIYPNEIGVLTNNPPFETQLFLLNAYRGLSPKTPPARFSRSHGFEEYSRGMGTLFLPGDLTSPSRFVRCAFMNANATTPDSEVGRVTQFFHILASVEQIHGCVEVGDKWECTVYSSCMNLEDGLYYYTTYENPAVTCLDMKREALDGDTLRHFEIAKCEAFTPQNS